MSKSKLDVPVGTVVTYRKKQLHVVKQSGCANCYFKGSRSCSTAPCASSKRKDSTSVVFKLVTNEQA